MTLYDTWKTWVFRNGIAATAAAFTIGMATNDFLRSTIQTAFDTPRNLLFVGLRNLVTWLAVLIFTFIFMEFVFGRVMTGTSSSKLVSETEQREFDMSQTGGMFGETNKFDSPIMDE